MNKTFKKIDRSISFIEDIFSVLLFGVIIVVVMAHVFSRYVLRSGILWSDELIQILLVAMVMFASARAIRMEGHTDLQGIVNALPSWLRNFFKIFSTAATLLFLVIFFLSAYRHTVSAGHLVTVILRIPRRLCYSSMPLGAALMIYEFIKTIKRRVTNYS